MNRFIPFGICTCLLILVYLTSCRGDNTTTQAVTSTESSGTSGSPIVQGGICNTLNTSETCCNNTMDTGCSWVRCLNSSGIVIHMGCHNLSDPNDRQNASAECKVDVSKIDENVNCSSNTSTTTAAPMPITTLAPTPGTCEAFTKQEDCCGTEGLKLKCLYVNCTKQDPKGSTMCLNSTNVESKCPTAFVEVICNSNQSSTTLAPPTPTPSAPNTTSTKAPPHTTQAPHTGTTEHGQHFDGASFFGGMILMAGLFIIGFFAIKFYRARKDRSYRTL